MVVATTRDNPMMKCGHSANATHNGKPGCVICFPDPGATTIDDSPPDLSGRKAKCSYCKRTRDSSPSLAFFQHRPDVEFDDYYCGCRGWD